MLVSCVLSISSNPKLTHTRAREIAEFSTGTYFNDLSARLIWSHRRNVYVFNLICTKLCLTHFKYLAACASIFLTATNACSLHLFRVDLFSSMEFKHKLHSVAMCLRLRLYCNMKKIRTSFLFSVPSQIQHQCVDCRCVSLLVYNKKCYDYLYWLLLIDYLLMIRL